MCGLSSLVKTVTDHKNSTTATLTHARNITITQKNPAKKGSLTRLPKRPVYPKKKKQKEEAEKGTDQAYAKTTTTTQNIRKWSLLTSSWGIWIQSNMLMKLYLVLHHPAYCHKHHVTQIPIGGIVSHLVGGISRYIRFTIRCPWLQLADVETSISPLTTSPIFAGQLSFLKWNMLINHLNLRLLRTILSPDNDNLQSYGKYIFIYINLIYGKYIWNQT